MFPPISIMKNIDRPQGEYTVVRSQLSNEWLSTTTLFYLNPRQAAALAGEQSGIHFRHEVHDPGLTDVPSAPLKVVKVVDRQLGETPWEVRVGEEPVGRLCDSDLQFLIEHANPEFGPGQPDWKQRRLEDIQDAREILEQKREAILVQLAMIGRSIDRNKDQERAAIGEMGNDWHGDEPSEETEDLPVLRPF